MLACITVALYSEYRSVVIHARIRIYVDVEMFILQLVWFVPMSPPCLLCVLFMIVHKPPLSPPPQTHTPTQSELGNRPLLEAICLKAKCYSLKLRTADALAMPRFSTRKLKGHFLWKKYIFDFMCFFSKNFQLKNVF